MKCLIKPIFLVVCLVCWSLHAGPLAQEMNTQPAEKPVGEVVPELLQLGQEAMARRDFAVARDHFHRVLELDWNNPQAYEWWAAAKDSVAYRVRRLLVDGNRLMATGKYAEALIAYIRARDLDSTDRILRGKVRLAGAKIYAERYLLGATAAFLQEDYDAARVQLDSVFIFDPENAVGFSLLERVEEDAAKTNQASLQDDPEAWNNHLEALKNYRAGKFQAAIDLWEKILVKYPNHPDAKANIRQARLRMQAEQKSDEKIAGGGE